jgi:hypothetical protein
MCAAAGRTRRSSSDETDEVSKAASSEEVGGKVDVEVEVDVLRWATCLSCEERRREEACRAVICVAEVRRSR